MSNPHRNVDRKKHSLKKVEWKISVLRKFNFHHALMIAIFMFLSPRTWTENTEESLIIINFAKQLSKTIINPQTYSKIKNLLTSIEN